MKIAIFHNLPIGGAKRVLYEEVKYLSFKHDLFLYELSDVDDSFLDLKQYAKKTYKYDFNIENKFPFIFKRILKDYKNFITLKKIHKKIAKDINKENYDLVLIHPDKFTQAPFLLQFLKIPSIYYCEEWLRIVYEKEYQFKDKVNFLNNKYEVLTRSIRKSIDKKNARSANIVLANSNFTKNNIDRAYKINSFVCYPGVDTEIFKPIKIRKENKIIFVGEPVKENGFNLLENALNLIEPEIRPKINIIDLFKKKKRIEDEDLNKEYSSALVTVCLSYSEPFGLVALESMACGTPVIAVDEGGYKETVIDKKTGYLINRNSESLADIFVKLINSNDLRVSLGKKGREEVDKKWTWNNHNKNLEEKFKLILKQ